MIQNQVVFKDTQSLCRELVLGLKTAGWREPNLKRARSSFNF